MPSSVTLPKSLELWVPIMDGRWAVSSWGRVIKLYSRYRGQPAGTILVPHYREGYERVLIEQKYYSVHRLVANAFLGPCPEGKEVNHRDLDKGNNRLWNLEYVFPVQNKAHAEKNGRNGGLNGSSGKLTIEERQRVLSLWNTGKYAKRELARMFEVSDTAVRYIIGRPDQWDNVA